MAEETARAAMIVTVEAISWVNTFVEGTGTGSKEFSEPALPGDTVRSILKRLSARFPKLQRTLWDQGGDELGPHIEVIVNDAILGVNHTLVSPVKDGDRILLIGQYLGG